MKSDEELLADLKRASEGLFIMSESDYPFETVYLDGKIELSAQYLRQMAGKNDDATVETRSIEEFFGAATFEPDWKKGENLIRTPDYQSVVRLLEENLTDLRVFKVGEINIPVFILGKSGEGNWIGLSTRVVET